MKGKLGEEVFKIRLGDFVTEVDYEKYSGGDGKVDFTLTSDSSTGIQVKTRYGNYDQVQWKIDKEEIEKNSVLVCVLCQEEFSDIEKEYRFIMAGFLPTNMIQSAFNEAIVGIDELLYPGGLRGYLDSLVSYDADKYINLGDECLFDKKDYKGAILNYCHALQLRANEAITYYKSDAIIYYKRGIAFSLLGYYQNAIDDCTQAIKIDAHYGHYCCRGSARHSLGDNQGAIDDYTKAIKINANNAIAYNDRGLAHYDLGDNQSAINDFTQAIKINPNYAIAYNNRGNAHSELGDNQRAIDDFTQAIKINPNYAIVYNDRGFAHYTLGDNQSAINDYTQAINLYPEFAIAYYNRGVSNLQKSANLYQKQGRDKKFQEVKDILREIHRSQHLM
jgi:tetratricopeptide (TPR) repeat protein